MASTCLPAPMPLTRLMAGGRRGGAASGPFGEAAVPAADDWVVMIECPLTTIAAPPTGDELSDIAQFHHGGGVPPWPPGATSAADAAS